ncbi:MAG TPA: DUF2842 domain-containing protein [Pseudolabrys sp.]|jgi:uncharacterized membrane protein|nr:DUF2842 domain-containing protein [Pseudolabrys sp.]
MHIRTRKLIGAFALIALVTVWSLVAMTLAQSALTNINGWIAAIYYVVAGLGWVLPGMLLVRWMARPDAADPQ